MLNTPNRPRLRSSAGAPWSPWPAAREVARFCWWHTVPGGLVELGILDHATVRLPLLESPPEHLDKLRLALARAPLAA